jgi:hypothetical protein
MVLEPTKIVELEWKSNMLSLLSFVSVFYFCFIPVGFDYYRQPLLKKWKLKEPDSDLLAFTKKVNH